MKGPTSIMHPGCALVAAVVLALAVPCRGLDNGLGFKPPMG
jgi:hypothetical protein